jgi:hypothetical protein
MIMGELGNEKRHHRAIIPGIISGIISISGILPARRGS